MRWVAISVLLAPMAAGVGLVLWKMFSDLGWLAMSILVYFVLTVWALAILERPR